MLKITGKYTDFRKILTYVRIGVTWVPIVPSRELPMEEVSLSVYLLYILNPFNLRITKCQFCLWISDFVDELFVVLSKCFGHGSLIGIINLTV